MSILRMRPYRVEGVIESEFIKSSDDKNDKWCVDDLARSGLDPDDILASSPGNLLLPQHALAGYFVPFFDFDGRVLTQPGTNYASMHRLRLKVQEFSKDQRYLQPTKEKLAKSGLPSFVPYLLPYPKEYDNGTIYCVEGEKKTAAVIKYFKVAAFGIAGCQMWRNPDGQGGIHPWILRLHERGVKRIPIIPDGDIMRYDMSQVYGTYLDALKREGFEAELLHLPEKVDDMIVRLLKEGNFKRELLDELPRLSQEQLVQTPASLVEPYNLSFQTTIKGIHIVDQNSSNVMKLMENHHAIPKIWRDLDANRVMVGEDIAIPGRTELEIANFFQHNFGFKQVKHRQIYDYIQAIAKKNQRSPMLDYICSLSWDGIKRLGNWFSRYWGVPEDSFISEIGTKWLVSSCARMDKPGCKVDWMPIVIGPQGTGKTSMPNILFKGNCLTLCGEWNDKDFYMLIHSNLVVNFDELDSFGRKDASHLKAILTKQEDMFRPPYGASVEVFPRRCTFYGCGNSHNFLQFDPSGYRRYAIVEVSKCLDFKGLELEIDQLWAEAWAVYNSGGLNWWEVEGASARAEDYVIPNPVEEKIIGWINKEKMSGKTVLEVTMTQLLVEIHEEASSKNPNVTREIKAILDKLGAIQSYKKRQRIYSIPLS